MKSAAPKPANDFNKHVGGQIKHFRTIRNTTQDDLAHQLGISRPGLANIEVGRQNIYAHQLVLAAAVLGISVLDLLPKVRTSVTFSFETKR